MAVTTGRHRRRSALTDQPTWLILLGLSVIVGLVYANGLGNGFVIDDKPLILDEYRSRQPWALWAILRDSWGNFQGRPLRTLSYDLDYSLFGFNPRFYHLVNVVLHMVNTTLVYHLARRLLGGVRPAFLAALLFAVHPIQTEAVTYISGRKDLLATLFYLLGFSGFIRYCALPRPGPLALTMLAFLLSLLSKESAATLPATCLLYEWTYQTAAPEDRSAGALLRGAWQGLRKTLSRHRLVYLGLFGMAAASSAYALLIVKESEGHGYWGGSVGLSMLTMARVSLYYLKLLILPTTLIADYSFDTFPVTRSYTDPKSLLAVVALSAIFWALLRSWRSLSPLTFGGLWWFITLLPVSQLIPHHEMMAERFLYLPSVGAMLAAGALLERALVTQKCQALIYAALTILVVLLSARTVIRNLDWKDEFTLMKRTVADAPRGVRPRLGLGNAYQQNGLYEAAEREYHEALRLDPGSAKAHASLASLFAERGDALRAEAEYLQALRLEPDRNIRMDLARFYETRGNLDQAEREYRQVLALVPRDPILHQNVAVFYHFVKRDPKRAEEEYLAALALRPTEVEFLIGLGALYIETGQRSKAEEVLRRGLEVKPGDPRIRALLRQMEEVTMGRGATARDREPTSSRSPGER